MPPLTKPDLVILYRDPHAARDLDQAEPIEARFSYWKTGRYGHETRCADNLGEVPWHAASYGTVGVTLLAHFLLEATVAGIKPTFHGTTVMLDLRSVVIPAPPT